MPNYSKFSANQKHEAVMRYKQQNETLSQISFDMGVDTVTIKNWVRLFDTFGISGLENRRQLGSYSEDLKRAAVEAYLQRGVSQAQICQEFKIPAVRTLQCWIEKYNRSTGNIKECAPIIPSVPQCQPVEFGRTTVMSKKNPVTHALRLDAVSFCIEHNYDYSKTAEKFGVTYSQVYSWVMKFEDNGPDALIDRRGRKKDPGKMTELDILRAENRLLKAENRRQAIEIEALKKAKALERGWG